MNNRKNIISALVYQACHIVYGFVVPRLILGGFGSDVNGLVSSITQFLSFISLLEGGLGAVVLSELYSPIEEKNQKLIKGILYSCQNIFTKLGLVFVAYTTILALVYAFVIRDTYKPLFTVSLIFILSLTTFAQYMFSITYKLFLQADQKIYICNYISALTLIVNIIIAFIVIKLFPEIRILKLASSIAFFVQPLIYCKLIPKDYANYRNKGNKGIVLKNRWSGFAQNLAHYVNMNTDIVIITIFCSFSDVSIYSVYLLGITALRTLISYVTNSYQSALGKYIAQKKQNVLEKKFKTFCIVTWGVSLSLYCTCLLLINSFVSIYTNNTNDVDYYQPIFSVIITFAYLLYCIREPYRLLILAAGKFKETNFGSIMEAVLNIVISISLIKFWGLTGVAVGTLIAIIYRFVYFIIFLNREMLRQKLTDYLRYIIGGAFIVITNLAIYWLFDFKITSFAYFGIWGLGILLFEVIICCLFFFGLHTSIQMIKKIVHIEK